MLNSRSQTLLKHKNEVVLDLTHKISTKKMKEVDHKID